MILNGHDMYYDPYEDYDEYCSTYRNKSNPEIFLKTCKFCGQDGLHWETLGDRWRLFHTGRNLHECDPEQKRLYLKDKE